MIVNRDTYLEYLDLLEDKDIVTLYEALDSVLNDKDKQMNVLYPNLQDLLFNPFNDESNQLLFAKVWSKELKLYKN